MENLFITGLSGRTGRYFLQCINELGLDNYEIYATIRNKETKFTENINTVLVDLDDTNKLNKLNKITKDMDVIFHIVNIRKSINVINAAIKNNIKWVILVHTTGIYSKYKSSSKEYIDIENQISKLTENKNIKITILRPTTIFGSLDD